MSAGDSGPMSGQESPALRLCAGCGREFQCGAAAGSCWCEGVEVPLETSQRLRVEFNDCLCANCLTAEVARDKREAGER
jgi:hypothetical protein